MKYIIRADINGHISISCLSSDLVLNLVAAAVDDNHVQKDKKELSRYFPKLEKLLPEGEREELVLYIKDKVREVIFVFIPFHEVKRKSVFQKDLN